MTVAKFDKFIAWLEEKLAQVRWLGQYYKRRMVECGPVRKRLRGMLSFMNSGDWSRQRMPRVHRIY